MLLTTQKDKLKYLRKVCKENGMTFKKNDSFWLNGKNCYMVVDRKSGEVLSRNMTISEAYDLEMNCGFITVGQSEEYADYL